LYYVQSYQRMNAMASFVCMMLIEFEAKNSTFDK